MKRIKDIFIHILSGMSKAGARFPLTVVSLIAASGIICYMISLKEQPPLVIEKLMFALLVSAMLGMAAQFASERFVKLKDKRLIVYAAATVLSIGYFMILWPAPEISAEIGVRTFVAVFAMLCAVLWLPSYKGKADFNKIALVHFKAVFTSILYSGVLSGGIAAIIAAVDILLFRVNSDTYAYMLTIVWVLFATIHYLSLLPRFNSEEETDMEQAAHASNYPKFLDILVSYIAIPLIVAYTIVLIAYFVKILVTLNWPSGQLGTMVLAYSAAGLIIYVLSSLLENKFTYWYRMIFPKVLIPVVIMQLISVGIRLNAYGITESRYYVVLFGIFSITCGILLSVKPVNRNGIIALLAAGFAIISIIPPADAFTVSRNSQINRLETILTAEGILSDGKLTPNPSASQTAKEQTTSILSYLDTRSSTKYVGWLPSDFNMYDDMKLSFGFEPIYPNSNPTDSQYFFASIDSQKPLDIRGYDTYINVYSDRNVTTKSEYDLLIGNVNYKLSLERQSKKEVYVQITDDKGNKLVGTGLYSFVDSLKNLGNSPKEALPAQMMTLETEQNGNKLKIVFQNVSMTLGNTTDAGVDYSLYVFFGAPQ